MCPLTRGMRAPEHLNFPPQWYQWPPYTYGICTGCMILEGKVLPVGSSAVGRVRVMSVEQMRCEHSIVSGVCFEWQWLTGCSVKGTQDIGTESLHEAISSWLWARSCVWVREHDLCGDTCLSGTRLSGTYTDRSMSWFWGSGAVDYHYCQVSGLWIWLLRRFTWRKDGSKSPFSRPTIKNCALFLIINLCGFNFQSLVLDTPPSD